MSVERRIALVAVAIAAVVLFSVIAIERPPPHTSAAQARRELLALAQRQQQATWLVEYDFVRELPNGQRLSESATEANRPPVHVEAAGDTVTVDFGARIASCTSTGDTARCTEHKSDPALAPAEVYRVVTNLGAYTVQREPDATIAGQHAQCYRLRATHSVLLSLGNTSDLCFASDGVPLRSEVRTGGRTDTRVARTVNRHVTNAMLDGLLQQLDRKRAVSGQ